MRSYAPQRQPSDEPRLRKTFATFGLDVVMLSAMAGRPRQFAVLLCRKGEYAVCTIHAGLSIGFAPNYRGTSGADTILSGALTCPGLDEILDWVNREGGLARYRCLLPPRPAEAMRPVLTVCVSND